MRNRYRGRGRFMAHGHRHCGPRSQLSREDYLAMLEEYQRDLEQETEDVAQKIKELREKTKEDATA